MEIKLSRCCQKMEIKKNFKGGVVGTLMSNFGLENFFKKSKNKILPFSSRRQICKRNDEKK